MSASRPPGFGTFTSAVKRYDPNQLLPAIARFTADHDPGNNVPVDLAARAPWAYASMARESIWHGLIGAGAVLGNSSLARLYDRFNSTYNEPANATLRSVIGPIFHEQFLYQESLWAELSRTQSILGRKDAEGTFDWAEEFGLDITSSIRAALFLQMWVINNGGRYDADALAVSADYRGFLDNYSAANVSQFATSVTTSLAAERQAHSLAPPLPPYARRYAFNPLFSTPFIDLGEVGTWAPQSQLVPRALTMGNLYYRGIRRWHQSFPRALGHLVEKYVGRQLASIGAGTVEGEIHYDKNSNKSIDWIWTTPKLVVLIECKSAREASGVKTGAASPRSVVNRQLGHARSQIDATADLIRERHPAFAHIPVDRPMISLTVTAESFYLSNSNLPEYVVPGTVPNRVISLGELEHLVRFGTESILQALMKFTSQAAGRPWTLNQALKEWRPAKRNRVLSEAWDQIRLPS